MKSKKQALAKSLLALLLCVAMLVGATFAWFTDSVVSGINTIAAGNLDVELYHSNAVADDERVTANTKLFLDLNGNPILWEPGVVSYENLRVANEGDLALVYQLALNTANENYILDTGACLSQVLKVGVVEGGITATDRDGVVASVDSWTTLSAFLCEGDLEAESSDTWGIVIYWQPGDNDNNWNANNGKQLSSGDALTIDLGVKLTATQMVSESDSFGNDYDISAKDDVFPSFEGGAASTPVEVVNGLTAAEVTIAIGDITAYVPAGVKLAAGVNSLSLTVSEMAGSEANIQLGADEAIRSLDVHVEGVAADNATPITITLPEAAPVALNMGNYKLYHVESTGTNEMTLVAADADFTAHNQYKYDPATGDIVLYMASFSEVAMVANTENKWQGNRDYDWYDADATVLEIANADQLAAFGALVGGMDGRPQDDFAGKTVNLVNDIYIGDLTDEDGRNVVFYPIGYYNSTGSYTKQSGGSVTSSVSSFEGTFDGQGHTVSDFYQNTWEMFGDYNDGYSGTPNYYKDAMGLFGYVRNGTVKNLTVKNFSSDGEFTPTGVIAAYADNSTFENIAITNCNPRVYNTGNGGIIGIAGSRREAADQKITLKNITVDNTNKISALWGSWDVACGGLVGMFRGNADGGEGQIHFENCHVGAQIDVYNDVCANYQYYAYRYAGMLIGSVRSNVSGEDGHVYPNMAGITAKDCTVHFGTWNDYYYCEFEANSMASYSEDFQFSRIDHSDINFTDSNGNGIIDTDAERASVTGCKHTHTAEEDKKCVYLPFSNLVTGDGWGVTTKAVGDLAGVTILDREVANSNEKFTGKVNSLLTNNTYAIGDLFALTANESDLISGALTVSVNNLNENNPVTAKFERNSTNWKEGTLTLTGVGTVQIVIQDYYYCTPTVIEVEVKNPDPVPQVEGNLIVNGSFEDGYNGWNYTNWTGTKIDEIAAKSGDEGMHAKANGWAGMFNQTLTLPAGEYVLSYWYKAISGGANMKLFATNDENNFFTKNYNSESTWTYVTKEFEITSTTEVTLNFNGSGESSNDEVYFDNLVLIKKPIVANGGFEMETNDWLLDKNSAIRVNDAHSGNYAVQITNPSYYGEACIQTAPVKPNTVYAITYWCKRVSGTGTFLLVVSQTVSPWKGFERVYGQNWMTETSGDWVKYTYIVNSGAESKVLLKFTADAENADAGSIIVDDIRIDEVQNDGYIVDGSFETGAAINWNTYGHTITDEAAYDGNYSYKIVGAGNWGGTGDTSFATVVNHTYEVSMWVKVDSESMAFQIKNNLSENATLNATTRYASNTADWTEIKLTFTATADTTYINFCGTNSGKTAIVYVDKISVRDITEN